MPNQALKPESREMTLEELLALPVSFGLVTAARAFGIGRTKAHQLARSGAFPCRVLKLGSTYHVTRADLFRALGIEDQAPVAQAG